MDILIVRDPREPAKKCSLTPLRGLSGLRFVLLRGGKIVDAGPRVWLHHEGELLSAADRGRDLLRLDCARRKLHSLSKAVGGQLVKRRLPPLKSAYPRKSRVAVDPEEGRASVEPLYAAIALLEGQRPEMLPRYPWAEAFLAATPGLPRA